MRERKETGSRAGRRGRYKRKRWGRDEGISILLCYVYVMLAFSRGAICPGPQAKRGPHTNAQKIFNEISGI